MQNFQGIFFKIISIPLRLSGVKCNIYAICVQERFTILFHANLHNQNVVCKNAWIDLLTFVNPF